MSKYYSKTTGGFYDDSMKRVYDAAGSWPLDVCLVSDERYTELLVGQGNGYVIDTDTEGYPYLAEVKDTPLTASEQIDIYKSYAQGLLDSTAVSLGYDSIISLCSYKDDPAATYSAQGSAGVQWRSAVWTTGNSLLTQAMSDEADIPTKDEFLALLPSWSDYYVED